MEDDDLQQVAAPETKTDTGVKDNKAKLFDPRTPDPNIRILIHNVTLITEDDIQNWDNNYDDLSDQRYFISLWKIMLPLDAFILF